jgi:hypothetical protein
MRKIALLAGLLVVLALVGAQCAGGGTPEVVKETVVVTQEVVLTKEVEVVVTATPAPTEEAMAEPTVEVPFEAQWAGSAHADKAAEAFNHWNEDDPQVIPTNCAKCHSTPGFLDFVGADGTTAGQVDNEAPIGTVITCVACHNEATVNMTSVVMPSGAELTGLGPEARCMQCHQGRESTVSVNEAIANSGAEDDTVSEDLGFINIHYFAAAATLYGNEAMGGYQYEGQVYDGKFGHPEGFDTCIGCHNMHTLEVRVEACSTCHTDVTSVEDLKNVRMNGSLADYDGDGDESEGIFYEIQGLQEKLMQAIQAYASEVAGTPIAYNPQSYPYFFIDTNENGQVDEDEAQVPNRYNAWTPRLLKAAYNYQTSIKDPGAFAHNAKYIIEFLYDSTEDLNSVLSQPVDMSTAHRVDPGHFNGTEEAFRHWDEEGEVPGTCSKCHSGHGLPVFLKEGVSISEMPTNGLLCTTCHDSLTEFTRYQVETVTFPSEAEVGFENLDANLCLECHQGRESTVSVNAAIENADVGDDTVSEALGFRNPHYFAAGATLFGSEVEGAYQYTGKTYAGRFEHVQGFNTCVNCHSTHALEVQVQACGGCHPGVTTEEDLKSIRMSTTDFNGNGDTTEGIGVEVASMEEALYAAIQKYAADTAGTPIVYDAQSYPYFFIDTNGNGQADEDEVDRANGYNAWTPRLLRAAYNYQWVAKDPGAFAHNGKYIIQVLYDSLDDLGADVSGMVRP